MEALRARRASGLPVGQSKGPGKSKEDKHRPEIEALLANESTQKLADYLHPGKGSEGQAAKGVSWWRKGPVRCVAQDERVVVYVCGG